MTVAATTSRIEYIGNGTTVAFTFPFRALATADVLAFVNGAQRFDIVVTGGETDSGGIVTFAVAPLASARVWIIRNTPRLQPVDLHEYGVLSAETQEREYDRLTLMLQEIQAQVDRAIQFAPTASITGLSLAFPLPGAGQFIRWNAAGTALETAAGTGGGGTVAGVTTLNGLAGALALVAGPNITVTPAGGNITIGLAAPIPISMGGTGVASFAGQGVLYAGGSQIGATGTGAAGTVLVGTGAAPAFSAGPLVSFLQTQAQAGVALLPYGASAGNTGELSFYELAANGVNRVGFKAPDAITADRLWTLPAADGTNTQVLTTNGAGVLSWSTVSGGSPGVTSLNGIAGVLSFVNDTNVTVTAGGSNLTVGWAGLLAVARGGIGVGTLAANGVLYGNGTGAVLVTAAGAAGTVLVGMGAGSAPLFSSQPIVGTLTTNLQNAVVLLPYGAGVGETGELRFLERSGAEYVGFRAPDAITTNRIWTLPAADGTTGQVLRTDGNGVLTWVTVTGTGLTSLGGQTGGTQTFVNDTNVTISSAANQHTLGWAGVLAPARGGTGAAAFTAGSVVFAGASGVYTQDNAGFFWDDTNNALRLGAGPFVAVTPSLYVAGSAQASRFDRADAGTNNSVTVHQLVHATTGDMIDGFGLRQAFAIRDSAAVDNTLAFLVASRAGADGTGAFAIQTAIGGVLADRITIDGSGNVGLGPTAAVSLVTTGVITSGGALTAKGDGGTGLGELRLNVANNSAYTGWRASTTAGSFTYLMPTNTVVPAVGTVLTHTGGSQTAWSVPAAMSVATGKVLTGNSASSTAAGFTPGAVNVQAFGAVSDGRLVSTGAITTGTATLVASGANFVVGDIGKTICVNGAGAGAAPLVTAISARTNSTTVTLAVNAGTTVSNADVFFGTNDAVAIEAALAAFNSAFLPSGTLWKTSSGYGLAAGASVVGENALTCWILPFFSGALSYMTIGVRSWIENVTMKTPGTINDVRATIGLLYNNSEAGQIPSPTNNDGFFIWKSGRAGSTQESGFIATHHGPGSGDSFYGEVTSISTEFRDAVFRGDINGGGNFSGGLGPVAGFRTLLSGSAPTEATGVQVLDLLPDLLHPIAYGATAKTSGSALLMTHESSNWATGAMIDLRGAVSGTYTADFIKAANAGAEKFRVDSAGLVYVAGTKVVGTRVTGWTAATATKARTTFDTTTVTLPNLAARVGAMIDDLIAHGLIGA